MRWRLCMCKGSWVLSLCSLLLLIFKLSSARGMIPHNACVYRLLYATLRVSKVSSSAWLPTTSSSSSSSAILCPWPQPPQSQWSVQSRSHQLWHHCPTSAGSFSSGHSASQSPYSSLSTTSKVGIFGLAYPNLWHLFCWRWGLLCTWRNLKNCRIITSAWRKITKPLRSRWERLLKRQSKIDIGHRMGNMSDDCYVEIDYYLLYYGLCSEFYCWNCKKEFDGIIFLKMNSKRRFSRTRFLLLLLAIILNSTLAVSERLSVLNSIERAQESKGTPPTSRCQSANHLYYTNPLDDRLAFQDARTGAVGLLGRLGESNCKVVCSHRTENPTLIGTFC